MSKFLAKHDAMERRVLDLLAIFLPFTVGVGIVVGIGGATLIALVLLAIGVIALFKTL